MRAIGIKILKNKLSEYVRLAARGETILVTDRDQVVAELNPPSGTRAAATSDALLADLMRQGILRPPLMRSPLPAPPPAVMSLTKLLDELNDDRSER